MSRIFCLLLVLLATVDINCGLDHAQYALQMDDIAYSFFLIAFLHFCGIYIIAST